jgi:Protein of unknown function (DUF3551)
MRFSALAALALCAFGFASDARADVEYPYCLVPSLFTVGTCTYATLEQCRAAASGNVGSCDRNPRYVVQAPARQMRGRN